MQTTRQIERCLNSRQYDRLTRDLLIARPEFSFRLVAELSKPLPAAALSLIRLDELNQGYHPINDQLIRTILAAQEFDGGWGDLMVSTLCIRALMCGQGQGIAIDRGLAWIASLQKPQGIWPAIPVRRMPEDAFISAFILFHLLDQAAFRAAIRVEEALNWFNSHLSSLDAETARLWRRITLRAHAHNLPAHAGAIN